MLRTDIHKFLIEFERLLKVRIGGVSQTDKTQFARIGKWYPVAVGRRIGGNGFLR